MPKPRFSYTIEDIKKHATARHGRCLSKKYLGNAVHLKWECKLKHRWMSTLGNVLQGKWCRKCGSIAAAKAKIRHSIPEMRTLAKEKGGRCLSKMVIPKQNWIGNVINEIGLSLPVKREYRAIDAHGAMTRDWASCFIEEVF